MSKFTRIIQFGERNLSRNRVIRERRKACII